ncbi:hypothetical protein [Coprobacillus sp. AF33-1AC]|uniref:hypothetical protein n=1 Tax=Coprobacillus sp. AF33-1AC TaxID=2292032 RepID=UPI000E53CF6B|nr:hypothetical protein [Coprobacillus sp. AF33-1AC]RHM59679.1 hypothetical protein DWZ53_09035 [Coprobacillus sp. AF33-1AC]
MENEIIKDLKRIQKISTRNVLIDFAKASMLAKYKFPSPGDTGEFDEIMENYQTSDSILMGYYGQLIFNEKDVRSKLLYLNKMVNEDHKDIYDKTYWFIMGKFS